jgi:hypothetical protein
MVTTVYLCLVSSRAALERPGLFDGYNPNVIGDSGGASGQPILPPIGKGGRFVEDGRLNSSQSHNS